MFQIGQIENECGEHAKALTEKLQIESERGGGTREPHTTHAHNGKADDSMNRLVFSFRYFYFSQSVFMRLNLFATA